MTQGEYIRSIIPADDWELLRPFLSEDADDAFIGAPAKDVFLDLFHWYEVSRDEKAWRRGCDLHLSLVKANEDSQQKRSAYPLT